ncbi:MAG: type II secretion system minor pseudopilin GspJ [Pseudomonadota bacterium]
MRQQQSTRDGPKAYVGVSISPNTLDHSATAEATANAVAACAARRRVNGFTLLELLVAIAVFAVLGLMSSQLLGNIIRQHDIIEERGQRLQDLQRAMGILERDIAQITERGIRDAYGEPLPSIFAGQEMPLEFTRVGWRNPLGHQRSELQRVAYAVVDQKLYRYYWSVLDRSPDTEPLEQLLLEDVLSVEFAPLDGNADPWPQPDGDPTDPNLRLVAINVRFEVEPYGEINRLFEVPQIDALRFRGTAGGSGGDDHDDDDDDDDDQDDGFDDDFGDDEDEGGL